MYDELAHGNKSPTRVFIVGWDGATFDLIKPWVAAGKLPHIAELMRQGTHGVLRSTLPPMTFPAWTSFMTGKNPGKHGIYDFTRLRPGSYDLEFVNGGRRRASSLWRLLSDAGRRVISISVPCTYPPEPLNGIMLSGFDAPGLGGTGSRLDARGMYPPQIFDELTRETGGHPIGSFPVSEINDGRPERALKKIVQAIREKAATTRYLMQRYPWDCCMILFGESDGVGHQFWKYCDPQSPLYTPHAEMRDSIYQVYQELDRQLGELRGLLPAEATLILMSDHGFGGVSNRVLYPNCWLREQGFIAFRGGLAGLRSRVLDQIKLRGVSNVPVRIKRLLYRIAGGRLGRIEAGVRYAMIDWRHTRAFFDENPYYPAIWVNLKGRQPQGTVDPGEQYEAVRTELMKRLLAWQDPRTGESIVKNALRREEVYCGPSLAEAPDIVVHWAEPGGYSYAFKVSSKSKQMRWTEELDPQRPENMAFFTGKSGSHRDDGVLVACGPAVRSGEVIEGANIMDVAPTVLHLLGVPVPADMDGKPLLQMLVEGAARSEVRIAPASRATVAASTEAYSTQDEQAISDRLRALGYLN
jgi:predicted AlkP superfamily phosphohydrolase/phosphomutase